MSEPRNPLCVRPLSASLATAQDFAARQALEMARLDGALANARAQLHDVNDQIRPLAIRLGMDADAPLSDVVAAAIARLR